MPRYQNFQHLAQTSLTSVLASSNTTLQITDILVQNHDETNGITLTIHHVKSGDSPTTLNKIFKGVIIKGDNKSINPRPNLANGDQLYVSASSANLLGLSINTWLAEQ